MADASIFSQYLRPPKSVQDYQGEAMQREAGMLDLEGKRRQNALQALTMDQAQRKQNALQQAAAGWGAQTTAKQRIESLRSNPLTWDEADKLETSDLARRKTDSEIDKNAGETTAKHMGILKDLTGGVLADPTPQNAALAVQIFERVTGRQMPEERARVAGFTDPEQVRRWAAGYSLAADKLLPQLSTQNLGGNMASVARDPLTGAVTTNSTTPITQSADNAATNARTAADAAANRAVQMRGQNMTDSRAREGTWSLNSDGVLVNSRSGETKAATGAGGKPVGSPKLTELQGKATGFASRMKDAEKTLGELEDKVAPSQVAVAGYKSEFPNWLPGGQILGAGITAANRTLNPYVTEEAMKYQQAQENWVTANLRLESGAVIGPEEMQKEIQKYFPQPGDPKSLRDQKKAARAVAQRAVTAQAGPGQNMIDGIAGGQSGGASGTWDDGNADPLGLRR